MLAQALYLAIIIVMVAEAHEKTSRFASENRLSSFSKLNEFHKNYDKAKYDRPTILTFYASNQINGHYDSLSIKVIIQETEPSLREAIFKARRKISEIFEVYQNYCNSLKNRDCIYPINLKNYKTNPKYSSIHKNPIFNSFTITNEIEIFIRETSKVGELVDNILETGIHQIENLEWIFSNQSNQLEHLMNSGMVEAKELCGHLKREVGNVISIKEVLRNKMENISKEKKEKKRGLLEFRVECVNKGLEEILTNRNTRRTKDKKK